MGQAKNRGTFEERREEAIRHEIIKKRDAKPIHSTTRPSKRTLELATLLAMGSMPHG